MAVAPKVPVVAAGKEGRGWRACLCGVDFSYALREEEEVVHDCIYWSVVNVLVKLLGFLRDEDKFTNLAAGQAGYTW